MATVEALTRRFEKVFEPQQATVLAESIVEAYDNLVKTSDFNELKAIVKDLAQAQQELAQAQQRTETRVEELGHDMQQLAQAQQRTESSVEKLTRAMTDMRREMGGMSRSMA